MFSELLKRCLLGDRLAGRQLYTHAWLIPRLEQLFKRTGLEPRLMIIPCPTPGPPFFELAKSITEKNLLQAFEDAPNFHETFIPTQVRMEALLQLQSELIELQKELQKEIDDSTQV